MNSNNDAKALKSGVWYVVSNFITKGLVFFTIPIFTRMLSQEEFGLYNNFISWLTTLSILISLNLESTFISARYEFKDKFSEYVSSMVAFSTFSSIFSLMIVNLFSNLFGKITGLSIFELNIIIIYILFMAVINQYQAQERYYFRYKTSVYISMIISVGSTALSVALVYIMNDKLLGRIIGYTSFSILVGAILLFYLMVKGRKVSFKYWKYALPICLPFIPHLLSLSILNSVDKIMITQICGAEETALYSLAYTSGAVLSVLVVSINTAFMPWLGEKLNEGNINLINKVSKWYVGLFSFIACGIIIIAPEIIYVMGGENYREAIYIMPPIVFSYVFQFIYTMYVSIEVYKKKTVGMAFASVFAALVNYISNLILLPQYGYFVAAYTTLLGFFCLMVIHILLVYRMGDNRVYNIKTIFLSTVLLGGFVALVNNLYTLNNIRLIFVILYVLSLIMIVYNSKDKMEMVLNRKNGRRNVY